MKPQMVYNSTHSSHLGPLIKDHCSLPSLGHALFQNRLLPDHTLISMLSPCPRLHSVHPIPPFCLRTSHPQSTVAVGPTFQSLHLPIPLKKPSQLHPSPGGQNPKLKRHARQDCLKTWLGSQQLFKSLFPQSHASPHLNINAMKDYLTRRKDSIEKTVE